MKHMDDIGKMLMNIYWSLGVAGAILIILGVLVVAVPHLLEVLVAIGLIVFGIVLWMVAYKVRQIWLKLPNVMK